MGQPGRLLGGGGGSDVRTSPTQDFQFILKGIARLLSNPLLQTYLPNSTKKIQFHQELLVLFWKLCDFNKVCWPQGRSHQQLGLPEVGCGYWIAQGRGDSEEKDGTMASPSDPIGLSPPEISLLCAEEQ